MGGAAKKATAGFMIAALAVSSLAGTSEQAQAKKKATLKTKKIVIAKGASKSIAIKNKNKKCKYTFTSSKKKVAKVSAKGKVKGVKPGTAKITVKEIAKKGKGKKRTLGKVKITVTPAKTGGNSGNSGNSGTKMTPTPVTTNTPAADQNTPTPTATPSATPTLEPTPTPTPAPIDPSPTPAIANPASAENPLIYSDIPDVDYIRVGEDYYMVSTTMFLNPGVPIMHSKDLVHWEIASYVYDTLEDNDTTNLLNGKQCYGRGSWAASIRYNESDKLFYVCFSSNDQGKTYIYTTDDIEKGNWKKHSANGTKHDPGLLFDGGKNYIFSGQGTISMQEFTLTEDGGIEFGNAKKVKLHPSKSSGLPIEGCHAYKIGEYYYLFFISWPSGDQRTEWCYRSKTLDGEWEEKRVFHNSGIAQGGLIQTQHGNWYAMLFRDGGAIGRIPVLLEVFWQGGWPMMGTNGKFDKFTKFDVKLENTGENAVYADDDFDYEENKLKLAWQWNHNPDNANWSVTENPGYLRLKTGTLANTVFNARNSLTQRTFGPKCTSESALDASGMKDGDYAGICAFQIDYGQVGVMKEGGKTYVYYGSGKGERDNPGKDSMTIAPDAKIEITQPQVYLKINYDFTKNEAAFQYSLDGTAWNNIGGTLKMNYNLDVFMGYRTYLYNYATKETGGYADFDYYKIY